MEPVGASHWLGAWQVLLTRARMRGILGAVRYLTWELASSSMSVPKELGLLCRAISDLASQVINITSTEFYWAQNDWLRPAQTKASPDLRGFSSLPLHGKNVENFVVKFQNFHRDKRVKLLLLRKLTFSSGQWDITDFIQLNCVSPPGGSHKPVWAMSHEYLHNTKQRTGHPTEKMSKKIWIDKSQKRKCNSQVYEQTCIFTSY